MNELEARLESASKRIKSMPKGQGAENQYAAAYQALVKAGLRPQIREKYRG